MKIIILFGVLIFGGIPAEAQMFSNPSFEDPQQPANLFVDPGILTDWSPGNYATVSNDFNNHGNTPYGTQYVALLLHGSIGQTVDGFVAGQSYTISIDALDSGAYGAEPVLTISIDGTNILDGATETKSSGPGELVSPPFPGSGDIPFKTVSLTFIPVESGSATISFTNNSTQGDEIYIDNAAITANSPAPESSTFLLTVCGIGMLGIVIPFRRCFFLSNA